MAEKAKKSRTAESIANTFEWIITAFVLAFIFRAFILEAFRIPTGSMADTLMGDHFRMRCTQCGFKYEYNFNPYFHKSFHTYSGNNYYKLLSPPRCPSCGYYEKPNTTALQSNGDRILVFKSLYQFAEPKRWDVFVFKNPTEPKINYIKRLIAKPGETLELIDGDVYINGKIERKPSKVQDELWMPVYNNNFIPIQPLEGRFNEHSWHQPFTNEADSNWQWDPQRPVEFTLRSDEGNINTMFYDTDKGNDFRSAYAYDEPKYYRTLPVCSDLKMTLNANRKTDGLIGVGLSKYGIQYNAIYYSTGTMVIEKTGSDGEIAELVKEKIEPAKLEKNFNVTFANVDHLLVFQIGDEKISYDLGRDANDAGERRKEIEPRATIFGSGEVVIKDVRLYRDIYYMDTKTGSMEPVLRAGEGDAFTLGENEFFAMGDNSPDSLDSRLWSMEGIGNNGIAYRQGVVPRDYLVGKAFFVYWPAGFRAGNFKLALVPNVGKMRFIYGGQ